MRTVPGANADQRLEDKKQQTAFPFMAFASASPGDKTTRLANSTCRTMKLFPSVFSLLRSHFFYIKIIEVRSLPSPASNVFSFPISLNRIFYRVYFYFNQIRAQWFFIQFAHQSLLQSFAKIFRSFSLPPKVLI